MTETEETTEIEKEEEASTIESTITMDDLMTILDQAKQIRFDPGYSTIMEESSVILDDIALALCANGITNYNIRIEGHINTVKDNGTRLANDDRKIVVYEDGGRLTGLQLSERRANSVMTALVTRGVSHERMTAQGKGGDHPVTLNRKHLDQNRRVEIHLY